jgi:hypothetical protein
LDQGRTHDTFNPRQELILASRLHWELTERKNNTPPWSNIHAGIYMRYLTLFTVHFVWHKHITKGIYEANLLSNLGQPTGP